MIDWTWLYPVGAGVVRCIGGWLPNAYADKKITLPELVELFETTSKIVIISVAAHFGIGADLLASSGIGVLGHMVLHAMKAKKK